MTTLTAPAPAVKSTPARVFGAGLVETQPTWPPSVEEARAWHAERKAEARTVTARQLAEAWDLGYRLARDGEDAAPPASMGCLERIEFRKGTDAWEEELCEGLAQDAWEVSGFDSIEDAEWHDLASDAPATPYCFA